MNTNESDRYLDEVAEQLSKINDPEDENIASIIEEYERQLAPLQEERDNLAALVEELRQQLAKAEQALATERECESIRQQASQMQQALATERVGAREMRRVLELCRHELVTLDNLMASDGLKAFGEALDDGCDANGAWDCYVEETWKIDTTKAVAEIDAALATDAGQGEGRSG